MLSLRPTRRLCHASAAAITLSDSSVSSFSNHIRNQKLFNTDSKRVTIEPPALVKLKIERDPERLFQLFKANAQNRLVIENRFAFEDTVSRLAGAGRFDYIAELLEHQKSLPQGRREGFIVRIIMLYGKAGMISHAVDTFYNMHLHGCRRTVKSFNAALKVLTQTRDSVTIKDFIVNVMRELDIILDVISLNIIVKALCEIGHLQEAFTFLVEMERRKIVPDVITYTTLIAAFYKSNHCEVGNGLWNRMVLKGCVPNLATFNARIQFLINRRRAWEANYTMTMMNNHGIIPDEITYNLVIKGFCLCGNLEMAKEVYSTFHGKGYKPNAKIYQTMIHYLCEGGDFDMAYTMSVDCMGKNWFMNIDTIHRLLSGLKKNGHIDKADWIMTLARRRVPPFTPKQLESLQLVQMLQAWQKAPDAVLLTKLRNLFFCAIPHHLNEVEDGFLPNASFKIRILLDASDCDLELYLHSFF